MTGEISLMRFTNEDCELDIFELGFGRKEGRKGREILS